ncbi:protein trichome birefringence-like 24 isoform X3 [Arachis ipaensis]|uniref:protein trichome birefringence-like 24 isoform X3 n=1 Tax=Arachis ipaensis TaxID=130454 RepID=UPI000A2B96DC|nr:protein trichome birefringence-like 24 isoform X3 [Arachis ipaensis]XP_025644673.1 protein trichome birefringence-like 24 isoform X3 [Arachis hypogaea]
MLKIKFLCVEKCDYFSGDWVPNPFRQFYTNETCSDIKSHQNCLKNGRPDREFLYWRWDPRGYELPLFDAGKFLNMMHGKVWALIGDSISRNHVQLLICILSTLMFLGRGSNIVNPASWKRIKHIRQKLGVKLSTLKANNQDKRRIGVRTEIVLTKCTKNYDRDFMY